ncbi:MAG: primase-like DNA-binding domain-containing protein [Thermoplasmataceae archaeon]
MKKRPVSPGKGSEGTAEDNSKSQFKVLESLISAYPDRKDELQQEIQTLHLAGLSREDIKEAIRKAWVNSEKGKVGLVDPEIFGMFASRKAVRKADHTFYFPGHIHVVDALLGERQYRTITDPSSDREEIWQFNGEIYERAEENIKMDADIEYLKQWQEMSEKCEKALDPINNPGLTESMESGINRTKMECDHAIDKGPTVTRVNEVLAMNRRRTITSTDIMNPDTHIPLKNGMLSLETWSLEPFNSGLFYTYQIDGQVLNQRVTLKDTPLFTSYLRDVYYNPDIPMILSYYAYTFYPGFPIHKVLFVLRRERIGKGVGARILKGMLPRGYGAVQLSKLLTADRFEFTGLIGKNLFVDAKIKRTFRRGMAKDYRTFNELFGGDTVQYEAKGKEARDWVSKGKGIFIGNLPFFHVDNAESVARMLLVQTKDSRKRKEIPELHLKILTAEKNKIITLLIQVLRKLVDRDFQFPGEMTAESTQEVLDRLADPVENFIEEVTEYMEDNLTDVDEAYNAFTEWCRGKGIHVLARQTFVHKFGFTYAKKNIGSRGEQEYVFIDCHLLDTEVEVKQAPFQVGYEFDKCETLEKAYSWDRYRRIQHVRHVFHDIMRGENQNQKYIKDHVQKLDTDISSVVTMI